MMFGSSQYINSITTTDKMSVFEIYVRNMKGTQLLEITSSTLQIILLLYIQSTNIKSLGVITFKFLQHGILKYTTVFMKKKNGNKAI